MIIVGGGKVISGFRNAEEGTLYNKLYKVWSSLNE